MGLSKELIEEPVDVCDECGAPLEENEDGELECTATKPCLRQVMAAERAAPKPEAQLFDPKMRKAINKMKKDRAARRN